MNYLVICFFVFGENKDFRITKYTLEQDTRPALVFQDMWRIKAPKNPENLKKKDDKDQVLGLSGDRRTIILLRQEEFGNSLQLTSRLTQPFYIDHVAVSSASRRFALVKTDRFDKETIYFYKIEINGEFELEKKITPPRKTSWVEYLIISPSGDWAMGNDVKHSKIFFINCKTWKTDYLNPSFDLKELGPIFSMQWLNEETVCFLTDNNKVLICKFAEKEITEVARFDLQKHHKPRIFFVESENKVVIVYNKRDILPLFLISQFYDYGLQRISTYKEYDVIEMPLEKPSEKKTRHITLPRSIDTGLHLSPDGKVWVADGYIDWLIFYDFKTGRQVGIVSNYYSRLSGIALLDNKKYLISSFDGWFFEVKKP